MGIVKNNMMKIPHLIGKEFIYGGHLLSLGASGIIWTISMFFGLPFSIVLLSIPYLISQVVYTYNHFREIDFDAESNPERVSHMERQKNWIGILLGGYVVALVGVLLTTNIETITLSIFIVLGGILYTDIFKELAAKYIVGFKNFYTSSFGAVAILLVPFFYRTEVTAFFLYTILFVFLRLIVNAAFFDIKDIESDKQRQLKTFAVLLGKKKTILLLQIVNLLSLVPLVLSVYSSGYPKVYLILGLLVLYGFYYLTHALFLEGKRLRTLSYMIVDAEYVFWPILIIIARTLA